MKKILYLHGLESNQGGKKVDFLSANSIVHAPSMNYRDPNLSLKLIKMYNEFEPDIIIGSSMGGYIAYIMGGIFNVKTILLNPALHSRSFDPILGDLEGKITAPPESIVVLGKEDYIVPIENTIQILQEEAKYKHTLELKDYGHRTPLEDFIDIYNKYVSK